VSGTGLFLGGCVSDLTLSLRRVGNGTWEVEGRDENQKSVCLSPSPGDGVLEVLQALGYDRLWAHLQDLKDKTENLEIELELSRTDYAGLLAFVEDLKKQVGLAIASAGDEQAQRDCMNILRKLIAPWPPSRTSKLN
jgi:hypothetical protein